MKTIVEQCNLFRGAITPIQPKINYSRVSFEYIKIEL